MKEFTSVAELRAHYREVRSRRPPMVVQPPPEPAMLEPEPPPPSPEPVLPRVIRPLPIGPLKRVAYLVGAHYGIEHNLLCSHLRYPVLVFPRQVFSFICCKLQLGSLTLIGNTINRDHTTTLHGRDKIAKLVETDPALAEVIEQIIRRFKEASS